MDLPFLKQSKWPISRESEDRVVNPSHDKQLQNHLIENLMSSIEEKNASKVKDDLIALIQSIQNEES